MPDLGYQTTNRVLDIASAQGDSGAGIKWTQTGWGIAHVRMLDCSELDGTNTDTNCLSYIRLDLAETKLGNDGDFSICTNSSCN